MLRRTFAICLAAAAASPALAAPQPQPSSLAFLAYRNGKKIGKQRMAFVTTADGLTVRSRAEMAVRLGPVTLFRYLHEAVERWRAGRFESLETRTNANGKRESVSAWRGDGGVSIRRDGGAAIVASAEALPFTHWNLEITRAPLFHPQTGKLLSQSARTLGREAIALADGRTVQARRVAFTGEAQIDNWYDADGVWTGLRGRLDDGSILEYRRI
jgi:hypothetical protein